MSAVDYVGIGKRYGSVRVMQDVNFSIEERRFVVLLGPSGCGKTTLLRMTAGLEKVTEGDIRFDGERVNDVHPRDRDIAMVFQSYALYPQMTVYDNIAFALQVRRQSKSLIDERVQEAAEMLDLAQLLDRYPKALSGGQRQRVAMGRALVRHPKVFLFDEPLSNLDAKLRGQMRYEIRRLHDRLDTTTIYVTHDQIEAMTMADIIVVMRNGAVEQIGSPESIYDEPANTFVADFIGSPSINFVDGEVIDDSGTPILQAGDTRVALPATNSSDSAGPTPGRSLRVGIRPLDIEVVADDGNPSDPDVHRGEVEFVESTGAETHVHVRMANGIVRAVSTERLRHRRGDPLALRFDRSKLHLFDGETGQRIETR